MEYLTDKDYTHLNTVNTIEDWTMSDIKASTTYVAYLRSVTLC